MVATCDVPECQTTYVFVDPQDSEAHRPYVTLNRLEWDTTVNTDQAVLIYCPDHNTQEKRS